MADYSSLNGEFSIKTESEIHDGFGVDELDHIPFKKRLKMLLASNLDSGRDVLERESKKLKMSSPPIDVAIKVEQALYPSQELLNHSAVSIMDVKDRILLQEHIYAYADKIPATLCSQITISSQNENYPRDRNRQETQTNDSISSNQINCPDAKGSTVTLQQVDPNIPNLTEHQNLTTSTVKVKVEYSDSDLMVRGGDGTEDPDLANDELIGVKIGIRDEPTADDILHQDWNRQETETNYSICASQKTCSEAKDSTISLKKVNTGIHNPAHHPNLTTSIVKVKVEYSDIDRGRNDRKDSDHANVESSHDPPTDDLDHIPLNERKRILLTRQTLGTVGQLHISGLLEGTSGNLMDGIYQHNARKVEEESHSADEQHSLTRNKSHSIPESNASELFRSSEAFAELKSPGVQENGRICSTHSTQKTSAELKSSIGQQVLTAIPDNSRGYHSKKKKKTNLRGSSLSDFLVKMEDETFESSLESSQKEPNLRGSSLSDFFVKMEVETFESSLESSQKDTVGTYLNGNLLAVKGETGVSYESYEDELDHMPLRQRIKLLISSKVSHLDNSKNLKRFRKTVPSVLEGIPAVPVNAKHGRKRKKTATDSVETALEEDAPGLLQVLIDKGILVDEIKLYGAMENEEALDSSLEEDSFGDLEAVISKLFSERSSLLKFAPLRCPKGSKDTYCLSCLISLVEQSRYLRFRNWPVEWGWCRDLQSFIFVFERHNRIVLERPQYGYATYFFELVDSLPVHWQVKRLVIAMKLTSCSRATIIENKQLLVGEHLTEGEAGVLEEYGWIPNSGLGSMLNYRDRVVHDKSNERDGAEWRSKIGKLLMNGYDGGTIIMTNLPKKFMEYKSTRNPQIKLEPFM